jgi:hypothetical protein
MTAPLFVLIACLFCLAAIVTSFFSRRQPSHSDENAINSPTALDAAIAMQRSRRIAELRERATGHNYVAYALVGAAVLAQIAALATDHFAHASISAVSILPAMAAVFVGQAAKRRLARQELKAYLNGQRSQ